METESIGRDSSQGLEIGVDETIISVVRAPGQGPTLPINADEQMDPPLPGREKPAEFVDIREDARGSCQNDLNMENPDGSSNNLDHVDYMHGTTIENDLHDMKSSHCDTAEQSVLMGTVQNHMTSQESLERDAETETASLAGTCQLALGLDQVDDPVIADSPMGVYMGSNSSVNIHGNQLSDSTCTLDIPEPQCDLYENTEHCGYVTVTAHDDNLRNPALNSMDTISPAMSEIHMSDVSSTDYIHAISMSEKLDIALPASSYDTIDADINDFPLGEAMDTQSLTSLSDLGQDGPDLLDLTPVHHQLLPMSICSDFTSVTETANSTLGSAPMSVVSSLHAYSEPVLKEPLSYELQQGFRVLYEIMSDSNKNNNWPFMNAIDSYFEDCEHYYSIIKQPMWLRKMEDKFDSREYKTITEYVADMRLMLENCYRFNGPDHTISKKGQRMETMMEQKLTLLSRSLREKTSIAATSGKPMEEKKIAGSRRRKAIVPHDSTGLLNQLRLEAQEKEKGARRVLIQERKHALHAYQHELETWEDRLFEGGLRDQMTRMWELPQIGHFLFLCSIPMNIGEVVQWELERCFLLPRESTTMQRVMTALLSTPYQRTSLDRKPMMPYAVWEDKLRTRLRQWYKFLQDNGRDVKKTTIKLGLEDKLFQVLGLCSPLEKKMYHELSYYQRVWVVKALCDWCLESQDSIREAIENQALTEQRPYELGSDGDGFTYLHFPQFCGADLRIYRQAYVKMGKRDQEARERSRSPKKMLSKKRRPTPRKKVTPVKDKDLSTAIDTPRSRDSRLRQNPRRTSQHYLGVSETEDDCETSTQKSSVVDTASDVESNQDSSGKDSGISEESGDDEPPPKTVKTSSSRAKSDVNLDVLIESTPSRLTRSAMRNLSKVFSANNTPSASRENSPGRRSRSRRKQNLKKLITSRDSTPSTKSEMRSRDVSPLSDVGRTPSTLTLDENPAESMLNLSRTCDDDSRSTEMDDGLAEFESKVKTEPMAYIDAVQTEPMDSEIKTELTEYEGETDRTTSVESREPSVNSKQMNILDIGTINPDGSENYHVKEIEADKESIDHDVCLDNEKCDISLPSMGCDNSTNDCVIESSSHNLVENALNVENVEKYCANVLSGENSKKDLISDNDSVVSEHIKVNTAMSDSTGRPIVEQTENDMDNLNCDSQHSVAAKDGLNTLPSDGLKLVSSDDKNLAQSDSRDSILTSRLSESPTSVHSSRSPTPVDFGDTVEDRGTLDEHVVSPMPLPEGDSTKTRLEDEVSLASTISAVDSNYRPESLKYQNIPRLMRQEQQTNAFSDDTVLNNDAGEMAETSLSKKCPGIGEKTEAADDLIGSVDSSKPMINTKISESTNQEGGDKKPMTLGTGGTETEGLKVKEEEEEFEEVFPEIGAFEMVVHDVDSLRKLITKLAEPEQTEDADKQKPGTRRRCSVDLHNRLTYLLQELEPWEHKLTSLYKKGIIKMRKEQETYIEEPVKEEIEDVWESEESASEASDIEEAPKVEKKVEVKPEPTVTDDGTIGVTTRGGFKRKKKPGDRGSTKKKKPTEVKEPSVSPNILQKKSTAAAATHPALQAALSSYKLTAAQSQGAIAFVGNRPVLLQPHQLSGLKLAQIGTHAPGTQPQFALISAGGSTTPMLLTTQNPSQVQQKIQVIPTTLSAGGTGSPMILTAQDPSKHFQKNIQVIPTTLTSSGTGAPMILTAQTPSRFQKKISQIIPKTLGVGGTGASMIVKVQHPAEQKCTQPFTTVLGVSSIGKTDKIEQSRIILGSGDNQATHIGKDLSTDGKQPSHERQHSEDGKEPSEDEKQPSEDEKQPSEDEKQPSEDEKQPSEDGKQFSEGNESSEDGKQLSDGNESSEDGKQLSDGNKSSEDGKQLSDGNESSQDGKQLSDGNESSQDGRLLTVKSTQPLVYGKPGLSVVTSTATSTTFQAIVSPTNQSTTVHTISSASNDPSSCVDTTKRVIPCFNYSNISQLPAQVVQQLLKTQEQRLQQCQIVGPVITTAACSVSTMVTSCHPTAFTKVLPARVCTGTSGAPIVTHLIAPSVPQPVAPSVSANIGDSADTDDSYDSGNNRDEVITISPSPDDDVIILSPSPPTVSDEPESLGSPAESMDLDSKSDIYTTEMTDGATSTDPVSSQSVAVTAMANNLLPTSAPAAQISKITEIGLSKKKQTSGEKSLMPSLPLKQPTDAVKTEMDISTYELLTSPQKPPKYASNVTVKTLLENKHAKQKYSSNSTGTACSVADENLKSPKSTTPSKLSGKLMPNILSPSRKGPGSTTPVQKFKGPVQLLPSAARQVQLIQTAGQQVFIQKAAAQLQVGLPDGDRGQVLQGAGGQLVQVVQTPQGQRLQVIQGAKQPHIQLIQTPTGQGLPMLRSPTSIKPGNQLPVPSATPVQKTPQTLKPKLSKLVELTPHMSQPARKTHVYLPSQKPQMSLPTQKSQISLSARKQISVPTHNPLVVDETKSTSVASELVNVDNSGDEKTLDPKIKSQQPEISDPACQPHELSTLQTSDAALSELHECAPSDTHKVVIVTKATRVSTVSDALVYASVTTAAIAPKPKLLHVGASGQKVIPLTPQVAAQLKVAMAKNQAIDQALKTVMTSVTTSLPTAHIKVSSPFEMPSGRPQRPVTVTTPAMKAPIPAVKAMDFHTSTATHKTVVKESLYQVDLAAVSQSGVPSFSQVGVSGVSQTGITAVSQAGMPAVSQSGVPSLTQAGVPSLSRAGMPAMSQAGIPFISQAGVPSASPAGVPSVTMYAAGSTQIRSISSPDAQQTPEAAPRISIPAPIKPELQMGHPHTAQGQPQQLPGQSPTTLGQQTAIISSSSCMAQSAMPTVTPGVSVPVQVNNQEVKTVQKNIGLRLSPQTIMTSQGPVQGVVIPAGVVLSEGVLHQLKSLAYTQGLSVFLQTKEGNLQLMIAGLTNTINVEPSVLREHIIPQASPAPKKRKLSDKLSDKLSKIQSQLEEETSPVSNALTSASAPLTQTQIKPIVIKPVTLPAKSTLSAQLALARLQVPLPITTHSNTLIKPQPQIPTPLGMASPSTVPIQINQQESEASSIPSSVATAACLLPATPLISNPNLHLNSSQGVMPSTQTQLQGSLKNVMSYMEEAMNVLTSRPQNSLVVTPQQTCGVSLPVYKPPQTVAHQLRPTSIHQIETPSNHQPMYLHETTTAQAAPSNHQPSSVIVTRGTTITRTVPSSVISNNLMSSNQLIQLPTGQILKQATAGLPDTEIVTPFGSGHKMLSPLGSDNSKVATSHLFTTGNVIVSAPGVVMQPSKVQSSVQVTSATTQHFASQDLLQMVQKQQALTKSVAAPSVNLIRGSMPNQPSKLVVFNVNGKLMTAEGVPVNLTQGLVKVGNQVIGAQAGVKTQQIAPPMSPENRTMRSPIKPLEETSRNAAVGGLQMLAGAASLSSVQLGQGDCEVPSGLQVLANAAKLTSETSLATEM